MRLQDLKQKVWEDWERQCWCNQAIVQPERFKPEIRSYGDLRCKGTWVKALCRLRAFNIWQGCMDSWTLITIHFNFRPDRWDYEFRYQILDEFLSIPGSLDALKVGFEQLLGAEIGFTSQEKEAGYEFLEMVSQESGGTRGESVSTRFERLQSQLQSSTS